MTDRRKSIMKDLCIKTTTGTETVLGEATIEDFGSRLHGELIRPGDEGYEDARQLWNGMIDRKPALIVRATSPTDVAAAVNLARENDLLLAVRGGGHNVAGTAMAERALVLDLSAMKEIEVDPERCTARAGAGVTIGELDVCCQVYAHSSLMRPCGRPRRRLTKKPYV